MTITFEELARVSVAPFIELLVTQLDDTRQPAPCLAVMLIRTDELGDQVLARWESWVPAERALLRLRIIDPMTALLATPSIAFHLPIE